MNGHVGLVQHVAPFMASTPVLIRSVTAELKSKLKEGESLESIGIRIPSESYVNYQFSPKNPHCYAALQYTGTSM